MIFGALAALALFSCSPKEENFTLNVISDTCDATNKPFDGVGFLQFTVTGDGLTAMVSSSTKDGVNHALRIPSIPAGSNRVIEVRAYDSDPLNGGRVISMGRSVPFTVDDQVPTGNGSNPIQVNVFLRRVNTFTPPSSVTQPTTCQRMRSARAGHSATLLKDGTVFIAGGYQYSSDNVTKVSLSDTEAYDTASGSFGAKKEMSVQAGTLKLPKAFHTASLVYTGQVVLWGGEAYAQGTSNLVSPNSVVLLYDSTNDTYYSPKARTNPPAINRTQHSAAVDVNGKVLISGGYTRTTEGLVPAPDVEWYDPVTVTSNVVTGVSLPRIGSVSAPVKQGAYIAVAGGADSDTGSLQNEVALFSYVAGVFSKQVLTNAPQLPAPGRRAPGVALLNDSTDLVFVGGYSDASKVNPVATSDVLAGNSATITVGPNVGSRGNVCAVTLADGRVIAIGGRTSDTAGGGPPTHSDATVTILTPSSAGGVTALGGPALATGRYFHTCTALADGTVLVTGGVDEQADGTSVVLQDAWIYQPAPLN
jgi:hypothetical protein